MTQRDEHGRWRKGVTGNAAGRPAGRTAAAQLRAALVQASPAVARALVQKALAGDVLAGRAILQAALPPMRPESASGSFTLEGSTLTQQAESALAAVQSGELSPGDAREVIAALADLAKLREADDFERRLAALEASAEKRKKLQG